MKSIPYPIILCAAIITLFPFEVVCQNANGNQRAQIIKIEHLDESIIECIYQHDSYDADIDFNNSYRDILQIGKRYVQFNTYGNYCVDSIIGPMDVSNLTSRHYLNICQRNPSIGEPYTILTDLKNKKVEISDHLFRYGIYKYDDTFLTMKWTKLEGEKNIIGYKCKKASCMFKGRE